MLTIHQMAVGTIEIKGSKFIAHLIPMNMFEIEMDRLRAEHPKAVHWVSASRYFNEFDQIVESSSDDGEPKGTSGKPTLAVLQGHELINAAIITVRYFGGTKLGPGGLVRAYAEAANAAYAEAMVEPYVKLFIERFECDYTHISIVEYEMDQKMIRCVDKAFNERGGEFVIEGTRVQLDIFFDGLGRTIRR